MEPYYIQIIETVVIILVYLINRLISNKIIDKTLNDKLINSSRGVIVKKAVNLTFVAITVSIILFIWGVNQSEIIVFVGSVLTVIGVALFAQWSILSNITSSVIIFFNHTVKLNDTIAIMEGKEYEIQGKVRSIGLFFITIDLLDGNEITLPNNIFMQKIIKRVTVSPPEKLNPPTPDTAPVA